MTRQMWVAALTIAALTVSARAQGDAAAGERAFLKCRACHQVGETAKNLIGPKLNGLFGRTAGTIADYSYGITWDEATFRDYIRNPRAKIPGTKMIFLGIKNEDEIDGLVAYLKQFDADGRTR